MKLSIKYFLHPQKYFLFRRSMLFFLFLVVGNFEGSLPAWAWEITTHKELTEQAINIKADILNAYLIDNLGLESGLNEVVDEKPVRQWMIEGSDFEDDLPRPLNHFHDALNNRGINSVFGGVSAIDWSLAAIRAQDGEDSFSWNDAREYYFKALTSPTKAERDENWGKTFRALGQLIHLLQDSANPSHVRHDNHPDFSAYIGSLGRIDVDGLHDYMARQSVSSYPGATFFTPDSSLLETEGAIRGEPFSNLFDTNTYHGGNPGATLGTDVGIAEFTNANFFSDDTISGQVNPDAVFPFPDVFELVPGPSNLPYLTLPRLGSPTFPAARAAKLTTNQAAAQFLLTNTHFDLIGKLELDDAVYDAQAQNLIPRAIDYSAAVLEYFFRPQYTFEPGRQEYFVIGTLIPPPPFGCGPPADPNPTLQEGFLDVEVTIPSDLNFQGDVSLYLELPDKTRVLVAEKLNVPGGEEPIRFDGHHPHAEFISGQPVRWYVVLDGKAGPGAQEERAILADTDKAAWIWGCFS